VDAVVVLCAGVLTGILGACELSERLARDRILPRFFLRTIPITKAPFFAIIWFTVFCGLLYASTGANLAIVSKMFSFVWLMVMTLYPLAVLLLKFSRGRLPRKPHTSLSMVFGTLAVAFIAIGGNVALDPSIVGYAAAYLLVITAIFYVTIKKVQILLWILWVLDHSTLLHRMRYMQMLGKRLTNMVRHLRSQPVCLLIKSDELNELFHKMLYVSVNEETSCVKLVYFYDEDIGIPSEMEANWKILDETFPEITVDLILVGTSFNPINVAALSHQLNIPTSLMFVSCPGPDFHYPADELGTRIISL